MNSVYPNTLTCIQELDIPTVVNSMITDRRAMRHMKDTAFEGYKAADNNSDRPLVSNMSSIVL